MDDMARFGASFQVETGKLLDEFGELLLAGERAKALAPGDIDAMFRILHTIKGSAGMMGLGALSALTHALEELFVLLKKRGRAPEGRERQLFDLLFEALDAMRGALGDFALDGKERRSFDALIAGIGALREQSDGVRVLRVALTADCSMESVRAYLIVSTLSGLCSTLTCYPEALDSDESASQKVRENGLYLRFPASDERAVREALAKELYIESVTEAEGFPNERPAREAAKAEPREGETAEPRAASADGGYVAVRLSKLEALQNLTSELILAQDKLIRDGGADASSEDAVRLGRLCESLRGAVMALRLSPVSALFQKLHRAAREAGRKLGRDIDFATYGADIEIDKSILDALSESLVQIVRNAAVHGVESAAERLAAGKPLMGRISVSARNSGTSVVVEVSDDGRGISAEKVAEAARASGLADAETPATSEALLDLIMRSGVTTSARPDELSGRGVGLDVVRAAVEKLRGSLSMETRPGAGTTFTVRVPQSLAVMDCICLGAGGTTFLLPALDSYRLLRPRACDAATLPDGRRALNFEGYSLPLVDLGEIYLERDTQPDMDTGIVAVLEGEESAVALFADALIGARRAAIRPLPALLERLGLRAHGISACSILSEDAVGLVLDAEALLASQGGE